MEFVNTYKQYDWNCRFMFNKKYTPKYTPMCKYCTFYTGYLGPFIDSSEICYLFNIFQQYNIDKEVDELHYCNCFRLAREGETFNEGQAEYIVNDVVIRTVINYVKTLYFNKLQECEKTLKENKNIQKTLLEKRESFKKLKTENLELNRFLDFIKSELLDVYKELKKEFKKRKEK